MHKPSPIILQENPPGLDSVDFGKAILPDKDTYLEELAKWQLELLKVQQAYYRQKQRAILVFQGWDASGKGGSIRRLTEKLDPRGFTVHPIGPPTADEQGRHYLYRFQKNLPRPGTIAIFDRSWYERVLVERVEALAAEEQWQRAYQEINEFERMLTDDGVRIVKIFMHIDRDEQLKRLTERLHNPMKQWKLTEEDIRNRLKWKDYEIATNGMFKLTSTESAPWHVIPGNRKWFARVAVLKTVVENLSRDVDVTPPPLDENVARAAEELLDISVVT